MRVEPATPVCCKTMAAKEFGGEASTGGKVENWFGGHDVKGMAVPAKY